MSGFKIGNNMPKKIKECIDDINVDRKKREELEEELAVLKKQVKVKKDNLLEMVSEYFNDSESKYEVDINCRADLTFQSKEYDESFFEKLDCLGYSYRLMHCNHYGWTQLIVNSGKKE